MINLELLKSLDIFKGLTDGQLKRIKNYCYIEEYKKGDRLFREGDEAVSIWIEYEGEVDLRFELPFDSSTSEEQTIRRVDAHPFHTKMLGWSCFVPPYKMRLSAYCVSHKARMVKVDRKDLLKLFEDDPKMGYEIMSYLIQVVGNRFHVFQDEYARVVGENIINKW